MSQNVHGTSTEKHQRITRLIENGVSLEAVNQNTTLEKFQNIKVVQKEVNVMPEDQQDLTPEERILKDYRENGEVVWHTYRKAETLNEMDIDFKILAAIHSLKEAQRIDSLVEKYDEEWRARKMKDFSTFCDIFEDIESDLEQRLGIEVPWDVEDLKELRQRYQNLLNFNAQKESQTNKQKSQNGVNNE